MPDQPLPQPLDYEIAKRRSGVGPIKLVLIFVTLVVGSLAMVTMLLPTLGRPREVAQRAKCLSIMHQIGCAILMYQNDHQQNYPNSLADLLEEQITSAVFVCPDTKDTPSSGATTQAIVADWSKPGHLSYIYLGRGLNDKTATSDTVVLYEPLSNHFGQGMNVLFGDGHADWINGTVGAKIIAAAATGHLPIKLDTTTGIVSTSQPSP